MTGGGDPAAAEPAKAEISAAVTGLGWRYIHGIVHLLQTGVAVGSLEQAALVAARVTAACPAAEGCLRLDLRADRVVLTLEAPTGRNLTDREVGFAAPLSAAVRDLGLRTDAGTGDGRSRSAQLLEIAFDAMDIGAVRPFWRTVLGYVDEPGEDPDTGPLVDPAGQSPTVWFQQMDAPRPQRNRIHLDVSVPHDEAERRIAAALSAGGRIASDEQAPAFWVLADAEGNEACVTTWREAGEPHPSPARLRRSRPG